MRNTVLGILRTRSGGALGAAALGLVALAVVVPAIGQSPPPPQSGVCSPTKTETLYAVKVPDGIAYGRTPETATIPGPALEMEEGQCLAVKLINRAGQPASIHAHGVGYTTSSDGTPHNNSCVADGQERTYVFEAHSPTKRPDSTIEPGSAGYWHYHDHCGGTEHGTGGINSGLFGAFIVRRPGDPKPDRPPFVLVMIGQTFNLKQAPLTPTFRATEGERVEFVVIGHGELFHTFHLHGHRWTDNRTGLPSGLDDPAQTIDTRTTGPAESFGFQVVAGERVGPGRWLYHCHVQSHSDNGMTGFLEVAPRSGAPLPPASAMTAPGAAPAPVAGTPPAAPAPGPHATTTQKKPAGMSRPSARISRTRLLVSGRIARQALGGIVVTFRATIRGGRAISIRRRITPRNGRYALSFEVPRRATRASRGTLEVRFVGDMRLKTQTKRISLNARALRAGARPRR